MLLISSTQREKGILKHISVPYRLTTELIPDFFYNDVSVIFLSLENHLREPGNVFKRMSEVIESSSVELINKNISEVIHRENTKHLPDKITTSALNNKHNVYTKNNNKNKKATLLLLVLINTTLSRCSCEIIDLQQLAEETNFTLLLSYTEREAALVINKIVSASGMSPETLRDKKLEQTPVERFLNAFPGISKSDAVNIKRSYTNVSEALLDEFGRLENVQGIGKKKGVSIKKYLDMKF
ncbi:Mating-type switching protein swi10 [Cucumispora dikerogammari]|nr:Mating-type switching protein swi10 [Cucumispora dikerogammari]